MREEVLSPARVHERMEPRQDQHAFRRSIEGAHVDHGEADRRLASWIDGRVELGFEQAMEIVARGRRPVVDRRRHQGSSRSRDPPELSPRERPLKPRRRPRAHVEEAIDEPTEARGIEWPIAVHDEGRVVARVDVPPPRMLGHEHEVGAAHRQAAEIPATDC